MEALIVQWQPIAVAAVMMLFDILTGFAAAAKNKTIESEKMREGAWHKAGFFGLILLAYMWEVGSVWINTETASLGFTIPEVPAVGVVCSFIVAIEIVSILENLAALNPTIAELPVVKQLKTHDPDRAEVTVELEKPHDETDTRARTNTKKEA